jgi:DNA-directed RNA polymerase subunit RPC12/RpoP
MSSDSARDLLVRGVAAAKAGSVQEARFYLEWVLRTDGGRDLFRDAWWWLSQISDDPAEKRGWLEEILAENPADPQARRELAVLQGRLKPESIVDADRLTSQEEAGPDVASAERFACPRCGGRLTAGAGQADLACAYCGWRRPLKEGARPPEQDFVVAMATARGHRRPQALRTFSCRACGAPYILPPESLSLTCPHCGSVYVIEHSDTQELIPPDGILPFRVSEEEARRSAQPDAKPSPRLMELYFPMWRFDLSGQVRWTGRKYAEERRSWTTVSGSELVLETGRLVPASPRLAGRAADPALAFDLAGMRPYEAAYLADVPAETYQVPMSDAAIHAHAAAFDDARRRARGSIPDGVSELRFDSTGFTIDTFRLLLVPIWVEPTRQGDPDARFVNGQTGIVSAPPGRKGWLAHLFGTT